MSARLVIEPWAPSYGAPVDDDAFGEAAGPVDVDAEVRAAKWAPIRPSGAAERGVVFVDGVLRVEARVVVTNDDGPPRQGICASWAAGAVIAEDRATVADIRVGRGLFSPKVEGVESGITTSFGAFTHRSVSSDAEASLDWMLRRTMARDEAAVANAAAVAARDASLVVVDGPLADHDDAEGLVGYVKSQHAPYLPDELHPVVGDLAAGERTPLFRTGVGRWSWYLRLSADAAYPWSGLARLEVSEELEVADAAAVADRVTLTLPRYASAPQKDPRAPQNLYPIGGLERMLRHRLGDPALLHRSLRVAVAHGAARALA
ncbi:MAG: hypothetical protein S0880_04435 [Actinomycetota bacterium]|nr:hypothetical protein [Actinomycetota bacterium]